MRFGDFLTDEAIKVCDRLATTVTIPLAVVAWFHDNVDDALKLISVLTGLVTLVYLSLRCYYLIKNKGN